MNNQECSDLTISQDAVEFTEDDINGEREHYRYMKVLPGQPSAHNEDTCVYCQARLERAAAALRRRVEELEPLFEDAGVGRSRDDEFDTDDVTEQPFEDAYDRVCHGVLDIVFTGLTEERHGNAWCHYMYYGRLREWDGLIVLIGVPVCIIFYHLFFTHRIHETLTSNFAAASHVVTLAHRTT